MKELNILRSMFAPRPKRTTELIVPRVTFHAGKGSLNNEHWAFSVPYHFTDALDIKYEERQKDKQKYMLWTQGPSINFRAHDVIHSRDNKITLQVRSASPVRWDPSKNEMNEGYVTFILHEEIGESLDLNPRIEIIYTQLEFLKLLIDGSNKTTESTNKH
ncbi:hypothetical protein [uncultured Sphaerotilus sp.]|uniref:hypothetical protein n=1 Tax=uncultured Sphaerotilus sp. TaxID=474984 RepID=UPI0030CA2928